MLRSYLLSSWLRSHPPRSTHTRLVFHERYTAQKAPRSGQSGLFGTYEPSVRLAPPESARPRSSRIS